MINWIIAFALRFRAAVVASVILLVVAGVWAFSTINVEAFPDLYADVLRSRPGVTGLASLRFHAQEERLLAACTTAEQTDAVYRHRCVPRKAQLDLIYQRNRSLCWDLILIAETATRPFRHRG